MNLLDRFISITSKLKPGFILLIPVFFSCETAQDQGIEYELESGAEVKFVEFTLPATNIYIDSLRTDEENEVLVGNYNDDLLGDISAEAYFSIRYAGGNIPNGTISNDYTYDSIRISLLSSASIPFNRISTQSFNIHSLPDTLLDAVYLSNKSEVLGDVIGSFESDINGDTLITNLLLDDAFGTLFFDLALEESELLGTANWPTLAISPTSASSGLSQFILNNDTSRIYLYVTDPDGISETVDDVTTTRDTTYVAEFTISLAAHYTHLDRSGSTYSSLGNLSRFDLPEGQTILDPLYGISTVYSIEALEAFFEENENTIINSAYLTFEIEEEEQREGLERTYSFFMRNNDYFAPGVIVNSFQSLVMSDIGYLNGTSFPAVTTLSDEGSELVLNSTLFFQTLFTFYNEYDSLVFEDASGDPFKLTEFMPISTNDITMQRTIIGNEGVKLKLFYTEVD